MTVRRQHVIKLVAFCLVGLGLLWLLTYFSPRADFSGGKTASFCPLGQSNLLSIPDWPANQSDDWEDVPISSRLLGISSAQAADSNCATGQLVVQLHVRGVPVVCNAMTPRQDDPPLHQSGISVSIYSPDNPHVKGFAKTNSQGQAIFTNIPMGSTGKLRIQLKTWGPYNGFTYNYAKAIIKPEITLTGGRVTTWDIVGEHAFPAPKKSAKLIIPAYPAAQEMLLDPKVLHAIVNQNNPGLIVDFGRFKQRDIFEGMTTDVSPLVTDPSDDYSFDNQVLIQNYPTLIAADRENVLTYLNRSGFFKAPTVQDKRAAWGKAYNAGPQQFRTYFVTIWQAETKTQFVSVSRLKFALQQNLEELIVHHASISTPMMPDPLKEAFGIFVAIYHDSGGNPAKIKPQYKPWMQTFVGSDPKRQELYFAQYKLLEDILQDRVGLKDVTLETYQMLRSVLSLSIRLGGKAISTALARAESLTEPTEVTPFEGEGNGKELIPVQSLERSALNAVNQETKALAKGQTTELAKPASSSPATGDPLPRPRPWPRIIAGGAGDPDPSAIPLPKSCPLPQNSTPPSLPPPTTITYQKAFTVMQQNERLGQINATTPVTVYRGSHTEEMFLPQFIEFLAENIDKYNVDWQRKPVLRNDELFSKYDTDAPENRLALRVIKNKTSGKIEISALVSDLLYYDYSQTDLRGDIITDSHGLATVVSSAPFAQGLNILEGDPYNNVAWRGFGYTYYTDHENIKNLLHSDISGNGLHGFDDYVVDEAYQFGAKFDDNPMIVVWKLPKNWLKPGNNESGEVGLQLLPENTTYQIAPGLKRLIAKGKAQGGVNGLAGAQRLAQAAKLGFVVQITKDYIDVQQTYIANKTIHDAGLLNDKDFSQVVAQLQRLGLKL